MKNFKWHFVFLGAIAYGWMLGVLTKNGMPDIMALAASIIAPIGAGFALGRPLAKAYSVAGDNTSDKKDLVNVIAATFFFLSVGVAIGNTLGMIAQKNSWFGNDKKNEVELWRTILSDTTDRNKVGSRLFDKYLGKPSVGVGTMSDASSGTVPRPSVKPATTSTSENQLQ